MNHIERVTQDDHTRDARSAYTLGFHDGRAARRAQPKKKTKKKRAARPRKAAAEFPINWQFVVGLAAALLLHLIFS